MVGRSSKFCHVDPLTNWIRKTSNPRQDKGLPGDGSVRPNKGFGMLDDLKKSRPSLGD